MGIWQLLKRRLGPVALSEATVVFLGNYCDRGPQGRQVLDWLIGLRDEREPGRTRFLCGDHDHALSSFLDVMSDQPHAEEGQHSLTEEEEVRTDGHNISDWHLCAYSVASCCWLSTRLPRSQCLTHTLLLTLYLSSCSHSVLEQLLTLRTCVAAHTLYLCSCSHCICAAAHTVLVQLITVTKFVDGFCSSLGSTKRCTQP